MLIYKSRQLTGSWRSIGTKIDPIQGIPKKKGVVKFQASAMKNCWEIGDENLFENQGKQN